MPLFPRVQRLATLLQDRRNKVTFRLASSRLHPLGAIAPRAAAQVQNLHPAGLSHTPKGASRYIKPLAKFRSGQITIFWCRLFRWWGSRFDMVILGFNFCQFRKESAKLTVNFLLPVCHLDSPENRLSSAKNFLKTDSRFFGLSGSPSLSELPSVLPPPPSSAPSCAMVP